MERTAAVNINALFERITPAEWKACAKSGVWLIRLHRPRAQQPLKVT